MADNEDAWVGHGGITLSWKGQLICREVSCEVVWLGINSFKTFEDSRCDWSIGDCILISGKRTAGAPVRSSCV